MKNESLPDADTHCFFRPSTFIFWNTYLQGLCLINPYTASKDYRRVIKLTIPLTKTSWYAIDQFLIILTVKSQVKYNFGFIKSKSGQYKG